MHVHGRFHDVFKDRHVGEEVEALEDHADSAALLGENRVGSLLKMAVSFDVADLNAVHLNRARVDGFEVIDGSQKRRLSRARRSENDDHLAAVDFKVDPFQNFVLTKGLLHVARAHDDRRARLDRMNFRRFVKDLIC